VSRAGAIPSSDFRTLGQPVDRLVALYALVSAAAVLFALPSGLAIGLGLVHAVAALAGFAWQPAANAWRRVAQRWPRAARFLGDWYPLLLIPALYAELTILNTFVHGGRFFDPWILAAEGAIFGGQPSRDWARAMPWPVLSEPLHAAYLSYYLIIYLPPLLLYASGRRAEFRITVFGLMLTFFAHYVFFIYLPVQGPRYLFPAPRGGIETGFFYELTHRVLEAGSSRGAAFPSSHVGVAVAQTLLMRRFIPRLVLPLGFMTAGLALGAVYGGFHYATDAIVGAAAGAVLAAAAPGLHQRLAAWRRAA
jgi:membrane-associated phospholipid phosphatase